MTMTACLWPERFARFDPALTVCLMRYISDLHIGKVNSKTFHFGLDVEHKKYVLADFLRQRLGTWTRRV
jgi:hypothetical protein